MSTKLALFWEKHDVKILTFVFIFLAGFVAFRAGQLHEREKISSNIEVSINSLVSASPAEQKAKVLGEALIRNTKGAESAEKAVLDPEQGIASANDERCTFVGSKNSDKYHFPDCSHAKRIKPENIVCFSSVKEAEEKGYEPSSCIH